MSFYIYINLRIYIYEVNERVLIHSHSLVEIKTHRIRDTVACLVCDADSSNNNHKYHGMMFSFSSASKEHRSWHLRDAQYIQTHNKYTYLVCKSIYIHNVLKQMSISFLRFC